MREITEVVRSYPFTVSVGEVREYEGEWRCKVLEREFHIALAPGEEGELGKAALAVEQAKESILDQVREMLEDDEGIDELAYALRGNGVEFIRLALADLVKANKAHCEATDRYLRSIHVQEG